MKWNIVLSLILFAAAGSRADVSVSAVECRARSGIGHVMENLNFSYSTFGNIMR